MHHGTLLQQQLGQIMKMTVCAVDEAAACNQFQVLQRKEMILPMLTLWTRCFTMVGLFLYLVEMVAILVYDNSSFSENAMGTIER